MGFWHTYMGIEGGGTAAVIFVADESQVSALYFESQVSAIYFESQVSAR